MTSFPEMEELIKALLEKEPDLSEDEVRARVMPIMKERMDKDPELTNRMLTAFVTDVWNEEKGWKKK